MPCTLVYSSIITSNESKDESWKRTAHQFLIVHTATFASLVPVYSLSMSLPKSPAFQLRCFAPSARARPFRWVVRASQSMEESGSGSSSKNDRVFKELGLYALKKKIEDIISRAEMIASTALELEETKRIKQERMLRDNNLWEDLSRADESFNALANSIRVVNELKDLRYKVEEARLITELVEMDVINHELFKQAYKASLDVDKFLHHYEMSMLLTGPYDREGACVIIRAWPEEATSEVWAEKILRMYCKWAKKHGYKGRIVEKFESKGGGIISVTIEFELPYAYGYLSGEKGSHRMVRDSSEESTFHETCLAIVDVIPLFLERTIDLQIDDKDLEVSSLSYHTEKQADNEARVVTTVRHIPSGITAQSSVERSQFANKIKALNRLKAKLLVLKMEQGLSGNRLSIDAVRKELKHETRRYIFHPNKLVQDIKSGIQHPDLNSILNGDIDPLIRVHISQRHGKELVTADLYR